MKFQTLIISLFLLSISAVVVVSVPNFKKSVKELFTDSKRSILAKVQGKIHSISTQFVVLKIKQRDELFIEIYKENEKDESLTFFQKIPLTEKKDGSFTFQGESTNLAFADIDQDGDLEILVPVFDHDMTPRLHTFKYNEYNKAFDAFEN